MIDLASPSASAADERTALGLALLDGSHAVQLVSSLDPEEYGSPAHSALHALLSTMIRTGQGSDLVSVTLECARLGADRYGGAEYVAGLADHIPSTARDLGPIVRRIRDLAARRRLRSIALASAELASGRPVRDPEGAEVHPISGAACVDTVIRWLGDTPDSGQGEWSQGAQAWTAEQDRIEREGQPQIWATGFGCVDLRLNGGLRPGQLLVVGGRPGWGKTAFATDLALALAHGGHGVAYFPMEVEAEQWQARCLSKLSGHSLRSIMRGDLAQWQWENVIEARDQLDRLPVYAYDRASVSVSEVLSATRRLMSRERIRVVCVDYLQRMRHDAASRHDLAIGASAVALKNMARDLGIAVVCLVQLNRGIDGRRTTKIPGSEGAPDWLQMQGIPRASDIRDSGQIEQEADAIVYPVRPVEDVAEALQGDGTEAVFVWAKNRNGPPGIDREVSWHAETASYMDCGGLLDLP